MRKTYYIPGTNDATSRTLKNLEAERQPKQFKKSRMPPTHPPPVMHCPMPSSSSHNRTLPIHLSVVQQASTNSDYVYTDVEGCPQLRAKKGHVMHEQAKVDLTAYDDQTIGLVPRPCTAVSAGDVALQIGDTDTVSKGVPKGSTPIVGGENTIAQGGMYKATAEDSSSHSISRKAKKPMPPPKSRKQNTSHTLSSSYVDTDELHPSADPSYCSPHPHMGLKLHSSIYTALTPTQSSVPDGKISMDISYSEALDMPKGMGYQALNPHTIDYVSLYCSTDHEQNIIKADVVTPSQRD